MMPDADIRALIHLNTLSPILLSKYVVRGMMAQERGRVINVSSIIASTGFNGLSVYAATKASLIGFTKSLAREVGRLGVTVNAIAPGVIDTEMTRGLEGADRNRVIGRSALRRLAEVEDVAAMSSFLMGEGGRNITGAVMTVDAGSTALTQGPVFSQKKGSSLPALNWTLRRSCRTFGSRRNVPRRAPRIDFDRHRRRKAAH